MKYYVVAVLMMLMLFSSRTAASPVKEVEDLILGIIKGTFEKEVEDLETCIKDGEAIFDHFKKAIGFIKQGGIENLVKGFGEIAEAIKLIPEEVKDCEEIYDIVKDLEKIAEEFSNPEALIIDIAKNIFWHGFDITHHIVSAVSNFENDNFFGAGEDIGIIIHDIILSKLNPDERNSIKGFFVGNDNEAIISTSCSKKPAKSDNIFDEVVKFLEGFYAKAFNIKLDLDTCDADVDKAWADVKNAILEMEKFTLADIEQGLVDLYKAMPELVTAFQVCETAWPDIEKGFEKLKVFRDHAAYIPVAVTKAVSLHPIRTTQDSWAAYKAFTSVPADYKAGGEASGDMLELIIEEMGADESVVQILLKN